MNSDGSNDQYVVDTTWSGDVWAYPGNMRAYDSTPWGARTYELKALAEQQRVPSYMKCLPCDKYECPRDQPPMRRLSIRDRANEQYLQCGKNCVAEPGPRFGGYSGLYDRSIFGDHKPRGGYASCAGGILCKCESCLYGSGANHPTGTMTSSAHGRCHPAGDPCPCPIRGECKKGKKSKSKSKSKSIKVSVPNLILIIFVLVIIYAILASAFVGKLRDSLFGASSGPTA